MNSLLESLRMALKALVTNKVRAALTMLGIIIGVAAVIILVSVGNGFSGLITDEFEGLGTNVLTISADVTANDNTGQMLTTGDALAIENAIGVQGIERVAPAYKGNALAASNGIDDAVSTSGVTPEYQIVKNYDITVGRFITDEDVDYRGRVAVLGSSTAAEFFPGKAYPIGETIRLNDVAFEVIGVMAEKGDSGPINNDDVILVPLSTAQTRLFNVPTVRGDYAVTTIEAQARSDEETGAAIIGINTVLRQQHRLDGGRDDDFNIFSQSSLLDTISTITSALTLFLGAIAGISLLVGGIGIMNIMLVSVTERTREIGLRKAIGAGRNDIMFQFVIEAVALSLLGGLIGILLGATGSMAVGPMLGFEAAIDTATIVLAAGFSAGVGLFFGIYPAMRAAKLNPIEALRFE